MPRPEIISGQDSYAPELQQFEENERVSICEVLDRVLNKGVVAAGEVTISVAGVDLLYLGLNLVLTSIETARASLHNGQPQGGLSIDIGKRRSHGVGWDHASRV
jgi:DNA-binding PucR family transcriptional regulator